MLMIHTDHTTKVHLAVTVRPIWIRKRQTNLQIFASSTMDND